MAKIYNSNWIAKPLSVNFNHKQWRQDLAAFIKNQLFWTGITKVSRARVIEKDVNNTIVIKQFEIYDTVGNQVQVKFKNNNEIINTTHEEIIKNYFEKRRFQ